MSNWLPCCISCMWLLASASAQAVENKAILIVPTSAIMPAGPGSEPDDSGGFAIRVRLAAVPVKASRCPADEPSLELQMADTMPTGDSIELNVAQKQLAKKKVDFYQ